MLMVTLPAAKQIEDRTHGVTFPGRKLLQISFGGQQFQQPHTGGAGDPQYLSRLAGKKCFRETLPDQLQKIKGFTENFYFHFFLHIFHIVNITALIVKFYFDNISSLRNNYKEK